MRTVSCIVLFLLTSHVAFPQWNFRLGFIITAEKDSVSGYVADTESDHPSAFHFKRSTDAETQVFRPGQVMAFGIVGANRYKSIAIDGSHVFARHLMSGAVSLFVYDGVFYIDANGLKVLSPRPSSKDYYKTVLREVVAPCNLSPEAIRYTRVELQSLVRNFNRCAGGKLAEYNAPPGGMKADLEILGGYDMTSLVAAGTAPTLTKWQSVSAGAGVVLTWPKFSSNISVVAQAWYVPASFNGTAIYTRGAKTYHDDYFIETSAIRVPIGAQYSFFKGKTKPFVRAGVLQNLWLLNRVSVVRDEEASGSVTSNELRQKLGGGNAPGVWASAGMSTPVYGRYRAVLEVRYEAFNAGELGDTANAFKLSNLKLSVGIRL